MPELEVEETEEVNALSLIINENESNDDKDDEDEQSGELPTTVEGLQALLEQKNATIAKRNKSLKKAKSAQHRTQDENNTLQSQFEKLEAKIDGIGQPNVEAKDLAKEEQDWRDRVEDDPTQAIAYMDWKQKNLEDRLSSFLGEKFGKYEADMNALSSKTDPELLEYKEAIAQVRSLPEFADSDDATALKVAKVLTSAKVKTPRSAIGGKKVVKAANKPVEYELSEEDKNRMGWG
jgi:predicted  nucleic acid-binding Zn-ribbon protein